MPDTINRAFWQYVNPDPFNSDNEIEATGVGGRIRLSISEEQAVDSYNHMFTCEINLPREVARELALWLIESTANPG